MIIGTVGAVVGKVMRVRPHPNAHKLWLVDACLDSNRTEIQIVFGGVRKLHRGELVAVAPPGARVIVMGRDKPKKVRIRSYRGERSHGMLCSLTELGWVNASMDEVAVLQGLRPGQSLDEVAPEERPAHVKNWC